jgi:sarcosine dehydrogenase
LRKDIDCKQLKNLELTTCRWSADITPDYTPLEAGLAFTCKLKYDIPFIGRDALINQKKDGIKRKLCCFSIQPQDVKSILGDYMLLGRETVYRNNQKVGYFTSVGYGHHLDLYVGYAYVNCEGKNITEYLQTGKYELEIFSKRIPCSLHLTSLYDPKNERIKC